MKKIKLLILSTCCVTGTHAKDDNIWTMLRDKVENPPVITGKIVPQTLGNTGLFWYKLQRDDQPPVNPVYDPGPLANQVIDIVQQTTSNVTIDPPSPAPQSHVTIDPPSPAPVSVSTTPVVSPAHVHDIPVQASHKPHEPTRVQPIDPDQEIRDLFYKTVDMLAVEKALEWQKQKTPEPPVHPDLRKVSAQEMREFKARMDLNLQGVP